MPGRDWKHQIVDRRIERGRKVITCSCGMRFWSYKKRSAEEIAEVHSSAVNYVGSI